MKRKMEMDTENAIAEPDNEAENLILDAKSKEKEAISGDDAVVEEMQAIVNKLNRANETGGTIDILT